MNKIAVFGAIIILIGVGGIFITRYSIPQGTHEDSKLHVVASFYPMAFFASSIGGDLVDVRTITPNGVEPHEYEPSPADIAAMQHADIIIVNGFVEPWAKKVADSLTWSRVQIITAGNGLIKQSDPHVWLDPVLAQQEVITITRAFKEQDPNHAVEYEGRAQQLIRRLEALNTSYASGLSHCANKEFVTSHAAFGYIASRYGLVQVSIAGISPDEEPSVKQLADIATFVRQHNVHYIFFESLVSSKLSDTIAAETGAKSLELTPLEGQSTDYFTGMQHNLQNLQVALGCTT